MIENWIITTKIENDIERENAIALFFDLGAEGVEENEQEIKVYFPNEIINAPNFSTSIGNKLSGVLSTMWDTYSHKAGFFWLNFGLLMVATIMCFAMLKWLNKIMKEKGVS